MKKIEKIIIISLIVISIVIYTVIKLSNQNSVMVRVLDSNKNVLLSFDIEEDNYYELNGKYGIFHIEVKDGKCRAIDVECPNQICVHTGWISADNPLPIVCIPNGIMVEIYE